MTAPNSGRSPYGQLADLLAEQEKRLGVLEQSSRTTQLGSASVVDGTLPLLDALGKIKMMIGRQSDGTFAVSYANGDPPPPPAGLVINAGALAYTVGWDGTFIGGRGKPGDFARLDIHEHPTFIDGVTYSDFEPTGATVKSSLFAESAVSVFTGADSVLVKVVAVTLSDVPSIATDPATVTPYPVSRIAAGSVGALELAAELALLGKIILGLDPAASKIEISGEGLRKIEPDGSVSLSLGAGTDTPSFLSVIDPVTGESMATLSADGTMTARRFAVAEELTQDGESVSSMIDQKPAGLIAWYARDSSPAVVGETVKAGVGEIRFTARAGALYRVQTSSMIVQTNNAGGTFQIGVGYTLDGSQPTPSSQEMMVAVAPNGATAALSKLTMLVSPGQESRTCRLLLTQYGVPGSGGGRAIVVGQNNIQLWVEEVSAPVMATVSTGGSGSVDPATRVVRNWPAIWSGSWNPTGKVSTTGQEAKVGNALDGNGLHRAAFGFDYADIQAKLVGVTVSRIRIYLYASWWFHDTGGWMTLGLHNSPETTSPQTYPGRSHGPYQTVPKFAKPEARWVDLTTALTSTQFATIVNALRTGAGKGFVVDRTGMEVNATYPETTYAGRISGAAMSKGVALEITYTTN